MPALPEVVPGAGVLGAEVRASLPFPGHPLLLIEAQSGRLKDIAGAAAWLAERREAFDALLEDYGALCLRGFGVGSTADFERLVGQYPMFGLGYAGGSTPRHAIEGSAVAFEATRVPADRQIMLHQEMAYLPHHPSRIVFYCRTPPSTGGETLVGDMRRLTARLPDRLRDEVTHRGVRYLRNFRSAAVPHPSDTNGLTHLTWQHAFSATDHDAVEGACRTLGLEFRWEADDSITTHYRCDGMKTHANSGETVWFNHIQSQIQHPCWMKDKWPDYVACYREGGRPLANHMQFGDGGEIDEDTVPLLHRLLDELQVGLPWQAGDVMFVDNVHTGHGRSTFTGTRDVQVALLA